MRNTFVVLAVLVALGGPAAAQPAAPEKLVLLPVSGTNVHPGYLEAAREFLKDHLLATAKYQVITPAGEPSTSEIATEQALAAGRQAGGELVVVTHLSRLSGVGRLRLVAYRVSTGAVAHADTMAIAGGPDDMDPALKRMAVGLATGQRASATADIETVTQREAGPLLKESATKSFGLRVGGMLPFNRPGGDDPATIPGIGVFWLYDARNFLAEVGLDLHTGSEGTSFAIGIGAFYPFSRGNFTPYLGGAASFSIVDLGGDGANGLRLTPALGILFGRLSTVQVRGEIGYFFNTFGERPEEDPPFGQVPAATSDTSRPWAHGPQLSVGLAF